MGTRTPIPWVEAKNSTIELCAHVLYSLEVGGFDQARPLGGASGKYPTWGDVSQARPGKWTNRVPSRGTDFA